MWVCLYLSEAIFRFFFYRSFSKKNIAFSLAFTILSTFSYSAFDMQIKLVKLTRVCVSLLHFNFDIIYFYFERIFIWFVICYCFCRSWLQKRCKRFTIAFSNFQLVSYAHCPFTERRRIFITIMKSFDCCYFNCRLHCQFSIRIPSIFILYIMDHAPFTILHPM